ncbi:DUF4118 domain-containing protein [uncultured Nitrosomonas sp.]|uniref:DUF4118 domain-containing protein n=1 Tax=uncultured Nitrosomonas sp. TaxID=156424 RepID=UPI00261CB25C|nr:DUF4118 domain-containing protein [uncultured Nitrosomonas sp.]
MSTDELRPDPDKLLIQVQQEEARAQQGRLKIFFGASAGVGKTYAMLSSAKVAQAQGVSLTIGLVETHGRAETEAMVAGLPLLSMKEVPYRGRLLKEFNLEAALAFGRAHSGGMEPPLVLLDELAHSNAPGSRHPKRWQDVEELLAAGIDVWSTMNVQHLESLNNIVSGVTGIRVWETVPDTLFDAADEVVVVDLPPDELLLRLAAGKVYVPEQARHAAANFFRKGNLIALRELALRRTADRVNSQMQLWRDTNDSSLKNQPQWSTRDAILACIGPGVGSEAVVRSAARLAAQANLPWHAVFVDVPSQQQVSEREREQALRALKLAKELSAITATPTGSDIAEVITRYAREHNLSRLVMGWQGNRKFWRPSLVEYLAAQTPDMDILQIPIPKSEKLPLGVHKATEEKLPHQWTGYFAAIAICGLFAIAAVPLRSVLELTNIVMLFLLAVGGLALRFGRRPAILAAFLSVALFDFLFVPPLLSFNVSDVQYVITFAVMLSVALVIGQLTAGLRVQAQVAIERERRVHGLYQLSRELSAALMIEQVAEIAQRFLSAEFLSKSAVLVANDDHMLELLPHSMTAVDTAVAQWCFERGEMAGRGTNTLPASDCLMLPLKGPMRLRGVLAVQLSQTTSLTPEQLQLLETCASLLAISIERIHYIRVAQTSTVQMEAERLRNALLAAISHDLRTPLTALVGLADTLATATPPLPEAHAGIVAVIRQSAQRMNAQVDNLLDMARLESGAVSLRREWVPLEEIIGSALAACGSSLGKREVNIHLPEDLPLLYIDAGLFERLLVNIFENTIKYTPTNTTLRVDAQLLEARVLLSIEDNGPGLPIGREESVFEKFERGNNEATTSGVGLGLAICRAIVQAHGGRIWGENRLCDGRVCGARIILELPCEEPPAEDGSHAADVSQGNIPL